MSSDSSYGISRLKLTSTDSSLSWSSDEVFEPESYNILKEIYELNISQHQAETLSHNVKEFVEAIVTPALYNLDILKALRTVKNLPPEALHLLEEQKVRVKK